MALRNKLSLIAWLIACIITNYTRAQAPAIQSPSALKFTQGIAIAPISIVNTGGSVPSVLYGKSVNIANISSSNAPFLPGLRDNTGNVFVSNISSIYKVVPGQNGSLFAGNGQGYVDGEGPVARFVSIIDMALDGAGNIYVIDRDYRAEYICKIRKIDTSGFVTTFAGLKIDAYHIAIDKSGDIFVTDLTRVHKISASGIPTVFAGSGTAGNEDGPALMASFNEISCIAFDESGNIYLSDEVGNKVRKINSAGMVSTIASIGRPGDLAIDGEKNIYVVSLNSQIIQKIHPSGLVSTVTSISPGRLYFASRSELQAVISGSAVSIPLLGYKVTPALPAGLVLNADGTITGTPTSLSGQTDYTITAYNLSGESSVIINIAVVMKPLPPEITQFSPSKAKAGETITITGSNFLGATAVSIGGQPSQYFTINSETSVTAVTNPGIISGNVSVVNPYGNATLSGFQAIVLPVITSFTPTSAGRGAKLTINGQNFIGVSYLNLGFYANSNFTVVSPEKIEVEIGEYVSSGSIGVTNPAGTSTLPGFTLLPPPTIAGNTIYGGPAYEVTINGSNFSDASSVKFGGVEALSFTVVSANTIKAVVSGGSGNGVTIKTPGGTVTSSSFVFLKPPVILSVSSLAASQGRQVLMTGANLNAVISVKFGGVAAASFTGNGTSLSASLGAGASGDITITTAGGSVTFPGFEFFKPPTLSSFAPNIAGIGEIVTITGDNFTSNTNVFFGGVQASSVRVISPTKIEATVGAGATSNIVVQTEWGQNSYPGFTHKGPVITSFSPTNAANGQSVAIIGTGFGNATSVSFGGVTSPSINVVSATEITAIVGTGSSGIVSVETPLGIGTKAGFTNPAPYITSSTGYGSPGSTVVILGGNFLGVNGVSFGGTQAASFQIVSSTRIDAKIGTGATGDIIVTSPQGTGRRTGFVIYDPPSISSFTPKAQVNNKIVTITGTNFVGATGVKFGGNSVTFSVFSPTTIIAILDSPASGDVSVTTPAGTATMPGFTSLGPVIQSFSPLTAGAGQTVTITGVNLDNTTGVYFNGIPATTFSQVSVTQITAVVPVASGSGNITVTTLNGSGIKTGFNFINPPSITSFNPLEGGEGGKITITGTDFTSATGVSLGGTAISTFTVNSATSITVLMGSVGSSGSLSVTTSGGSSSKSGFIWHPKPTISSIMPGSAANGTAITITGTNLSSLSSVKLGTKTLVATNVTPTSFSTVITNGEIGNIEVTTLGGSTQFTGFDFIPLPHITSFSVTGDGPGANVIVNGTNLTGATSVSFGAVPAESFSVISPTVIHAKVGLGNTGAIEVVTPGGIASKPGFLFKKAPVINSFSPVSGPTGTSITISGSNFNAVSSLNTVFFGTVKSIVTSSTSTELVVKVPNNASEQPITVINTADRLSAVSSRSFTVTRPVSTLPLYPYQLSIPLKENPEQVEVADMDGDGALDLVLMIERAVKFPTLNIFLNGMVNGDYSSAFNKRTAISLPSNVRYFTIGDVTADGKPDILYLHQNGLTLLKNTSISGSIAFDTVQLSNLNTGSSLAQIILRDMDMDGKADIILSETSNIVIFRNTSFETGNQTVSFTRFELAPWNTARSIDVEDVDGDGKPDIVFSDTSYGFSILRNESLPGSIRTDFFPNKGRLNNYDQASTMVTAVDLDSDSKPEIIEHGASFSGKLIVHGNISTGNGTIVESFAQPQVFNYQMKYWGIALPIVKDIDGDAKPDVIFPDLSRIRKMKNKSTLGSFQFENDILFDLKESPELGHTISPQIADLNGDGKPEAIFVIAGYNHRKNIMILHDTPDPLTPSPPIIYAFDPEISSEGTIVTITGTHLAGATMVSFGGTPAKSFTVNPSGSISAVVDAGASGNVTVTTPLGQGTKSGFTYLYTLPITNFKLKASSETCRTSDNGTVSITAVKPLNYIAVLTGNNINKNVSFTGTALFNGLPAGTYNVCIKVEGWDGYQQCFEVLITEPKDLAAFVTVSTVDKTVSVKLEGGKLYTVTINGQKYKTDKDYILLSLAPGENLLKVSTDQPCQGVIEKTIILNQAMPYPIPFSQQLNIDFGKGKFKRVEAKVRDMTGRIVYSRVFSNHEGKLTMEMPDLSRGVYILQISLDGLETKYKILRK